VSVTLSYETDLSRVKITATGFAAGATTALIEHSVDGVTWTTVRCGLAAPIVSGVATGYDYEFSSDILNYYRVTSASDVTGVVAGAAAHGNNTSVVPGLPVGQVAGDILLVYAAIHNSGVGNPNTPAGYTLLLNMGNVRLFGKISVGAGEVAPTVSFTGGAAGPTSAQMAKVKNVQFSVNDLSQTFNLSQQNVNYPNLTVTQPRSFVLLLGWKRNNWTSVNTLAITGQTITEIGEPTTLQGGIGQGLVWDWYQDTGKNDISSGVFTVGGGSADVGRGGIITMLVPNLVQTATITPSIGTVWIKSIGSPFLNRTFYCVANFSPVTRDDRTGIFEIINRSFPIAVTDLRQSREFSIDVITRTKQEHDDFDFAMALGEPIFLHTPGNSPIPTMHAVVRRITDTRPLLGRPCGNDWHVFNLPLREVAAPGADVCGSTITWQGVINTYATWQDVLNNEATWFDLMQNIGTPADVIVA